MVVFYHSVPGREPATVRPVSLPRRRLAPLGVCLLGDAGHRRIRRTMDSGLRRNDGSCGPKHDQAVS